MIATVAQLLASRACTLADRDASGLVPFATGAFGGFPYYWQNPATRQFNPLTYGWISANLAPHTTPIQLDENFTTLYIEALSKIDYRLGSIDQAALAQAQARTEARQQAIVDAWRTAFGSVPSATQRQTPIDIVLYIITNEWATPPTGLDALAGSQDVYALLNQVPARGQPVVNALKHYLGELGNDVPLINAVTMNRGVLAAALDAAQQHPAYVVLTPLAEILRGLDDATKIARLTTVLTRQAPARYVATLDSGESFTIPAEALLTAIPPGSGDCLLAGYLERDAEPVRVEVKFRGLADVRFGPDRRWFWPDPIRQAIAIGARDLSGFRLSPDPRIDFSAAGPFGFLTEVLISRFPAFRIRVSASSVPACSSIAECVDAPWQVSFLGVPLSGYVATSAIDEHVQLADIALEPKAGADLDARAWVLAAAPSYPAAPS